MAGACGGVRLASLRVRHYVLAAMADTTLPLSRLRAKLAGPRGLRKVEALLSAENPAEAVRALTVTELHHLVHDVGLADCLEIVALATPEQVRGCLDIDGWDRDELVITAVTPWLDALIEAGYEKVGEVWECLDAEFRALVLTRSVRVYDLTLGEEPEGTDEHPVYLTPDSYFAVVLTGDEDSVRLVNRLLDDLYRADPSGALARHTLMAARSEPSAELEEMSYRWRSGRMADLGYVDYYEALEVFRPLDPDSVQIGEGSQDRFGQADSADEERLGSLPVPIAERVIGTSFLARALDLIEDPAEIERLEMALLVLVNKVLAAARVPAGNQEAMSLGAKHAAATVALGLEAVSRGDLPRAAQALQTVSLTRLHRVGYTLPLRLARLARALAPRAITAAEPVPSLLAALLGRRPFFPGELDSPPAGDVRPFESMADMRRVAEELSKLTLRIAVTTALGVDLVAVGQAPEPRPALDTHVRTALTRAMMGEAFAAEPLTLEDLERFRRQALVGHTLTDKAKDRAFTAFEQALDETQRASAGALVAEVCAGLCADIQDELGHLPEDLRRVELRYLSRVLMAEHRH